jgi:hypothetical protein
VDPDPGGQKDVDPVDPDPDPQHWLQHHEYPEIHLKDELFLMWRTAVEGLCEDGRTPTSLAAQLRESGHRVLAGQVLAARQRYHTLQYTVHMR